VFFPLIDLYSKIDGGLRSQHINGEPFFFQPDKAVVNTIQPLGYRSPESYKELVDLILLQEIACYGLCSAMGAQAPIWVRMAFILLMISTGPNDQPTAHP